ncbi:MAG: GntR family transcriptional regulator [Spirochaetia bacterium]|nr:GntR family transcriptional regulator [Spirochaetia bacterium]
MKVMKSQSIYEHLENRIYSGEFNDSLRLPSEKILTEYYNCSRPTLRKALEALEKQSLITRKQGSGSFITEKSFTIRKEEIASHKKAALFGIIFPSLGASYVFDSICNEVTRILAQKDCSLVWGGTVLSHSNNLFEEVKHICAKYIELNVDGVFFAPIEYTDERDEVNNYIIDTFDQSHIPVILIDSDVTDFPFRSNHDLVSIDHTQASYLLTKHMIDSGARDIHFLSPYKSSRTIKIRQMGYREALFDSNLPILHESIHEGDPTDIEFVTSIIKKNPDAILCSNDGTAISLLSTLRKLGVEVPQKLIVAGFDNLSYLSHIITPLTSITHPIGMISNEAVNMMLDRVQSPSLPIKTVSYGGTVIARKSTQLNKEDLC